MLTRQLARFCLAVVLLALSSGRVLAQDTVSPLLDPGPYEVGLRILDFVDESRDNRPVQVSVWYPAAIEEQVEAPYPPLQADAPYPLIIHSHGLGSYPQELEDIYLKHLVSYGFVVAAPNHLDYEPGVQLNLINRPLDLLFTLDALAGLENDPLAGVIDTDNVGLLGSSGGAYSVVAAGGARIDFAALTTLCATADPRRVWECSNTDYAELSAYNATLDPSESDGLWPAMTDTRIKAVMAVAPCSTFLFGERGLVSMTVPVLFIAGTLDSTCRYEEHAVPALEGVGSTDRYLIAIRNGLHISVVTDRVSARHLSVAFFSAYLSQRPEYAEYLSPEWVETLPRASIIQAGL